MKNTTKHKGNNTKVPKIDFQLLYKEALLFTKQHVRDFSLLLIVIFLVNIINSGFDKDAQNTMSSSMQTITTILSIVLSLISAWLSMGFINISLKLLANDKVCCTDGLVDIGKTAKSFLASIITTIFGLIGAIPLILTVLIIDSFFPTIISSTPLIVLGLILLIFIAPVIFLSIRLHYTTTIILDQNYTIRESLKTSRAITRGSVWILIIMNLVLGIIQLLGILTFGIGFFRTIPFMFLAKTIAYKMLRDKK